VISLTQLNGKTIYVNPNLIEVMERTPDTLLTLTTGKKIIVRETPEIVARMFMEFASKVSGLGPQIKEEVPWT
jgi:flagellar protein FlbD